MYVDAHWHIDLFAAPENIVQQTESDQVYTIAVTNAPSVFPHTVGLVANTRFIRPAIGLHPELMHSHHHELPLFEKHLKTTRYVGEIGLDYTTTDKELRDKQRRALATIAEWAAMYGNRVLTLHSRRAAGDVISILKGFQGRKILHWFSGTQKELAEA
jgi:TatD DNase family protein